MNAEQYDAMMLETARTALAFAREENWRGVHETLLACGGASSIFDPGPVGFEPRAFGRT